MRLRRGSALPALLVLATGCQPLGEGPRTPAPSGGAGVPAEAIVIERGGAGHPPPVTGARLRALPPPEVPVEGIDMILHAPVSQDPHLRERMQFWIVFWTGRGREQFQRYLDRMGEYQGLVEAHLEAADFPPSLRYLPIVESGYHPSIRSRAGATGLWQLMAPTARGLGLTVDGLVDDRRDPVASTLAAVEYLEELRLRFDSWYLALSAYNAGPARVGRALSRHVPQEAISGDERYLRVRPHLPAETREFVPRLFAAAELASRPERYGFRAPDPARAVAYDEVTVPDATSLDVIATAADVEEEEVRRLNPHLVRGFTPPGEERVVRIPVGRAGEFQERFARIPPDERLSFLEHEVSSGETFTHIARRYGVSVAELQGANRGTDPRRLQIGQRLIVPVGSGVGNGSATADPGRHVVSPGESLWTIARRYGLSVDELARVNGRNAAQVLRVGEELAIP